MRFYGVEELCLWPKSGDLNIWTKLIEREAFIDSVIVHGKELQIERLLFVQGFYNFLCFLDCNPFILSLADEKLTL